LLANAADSTTYLHSDAVGSIIAATDSAGELVAERAYYPFGMLRSSTGYVDEHGFTGQEEDATTGLLYFRARYLDPYAGRWTAVDPLFGELDGTNIARLGESTTGYAYVANNPINTVDPTGLAGRTLVQRGKRARKKARVARTRAVARGQLRGVTFQDWTPSPTRGHRSNPKVKRRANPNPRTRQRRGIRSSHISAEVSAAVAADYAARNFNPAAPPEPAATAPREESRSRGGLEGYLLPYRGRGGKSRGSFGMASGLVIGAAIFTVAASIGAGFLMLGGEQGEGDGEEGDGGSGGLGGLFGG
jgi:RHS repeat-associated protein